MAVQNIVQLFVSVAGKHADELAFIESHRQITYAQLLQQIQIAAHRFTKKGIGKGDKVLVFIPMKSQLYVTVLALLYIGACPVFLDEWVSISRLTACLKTVPCKAIVAGRKFLLLSWFVSPLRKLKKIAIANNKAGSGFPLPVATGANDTAIITFTTGSTGIPKAANRTHAFLAAQRNALLPFLEDDDQTTLTLLPVVVLLNLSFGKTNILPVKKITVQHASSVDEAVQLIQQHRIQNITASPAITVAIAKRISQQAISTHIKKVITGGGPVFPDDAKQIVRAFPEAETTVVYGSTEAEPVSSISMKDLIQTAAEIMRNQGLPVGRLHADIQVAIIPYTTAAIPNQLIIEWEHLKLSPGNSGEIVVSGPHVLQNYINNDAAQQQNKFLVENVLWHRTGDEGVLNEHRHLYFRGRCTETISYHRHVIYPIISTWLLKQQLSISEAAILLHDEKLVLVIEAEDKKLQEQIIKAVTGTLLEDATIRYVATMPKDKRHHTKIDYGKLRQLLQ